MAAMTMTLISLYNFDDTLFDGLTLPESVNKDVLIYLLLQNYGEFEPVYTDLDFLKTSIGMWSTAHQYTFNKFADGFAADFNPVENYDRYEDSSDSGQNSANNKSTSDNLNKVSGFDSSTLVDNASDISSADMNTSGSFANTHKAHLHGNIGVTTAPAMLKEFFDLYGSNNIYTMIGELFADDYLIRIY